MGHPSISVIIPFSYRKGDKACLQRLFNTVACFEEQPDLELVIFDVSRLQRTELVSELKCLSYVKYYHQPQRGVFSPGAIRNLAVEKACGGYLFFCDADLLCSRSFVASLTEHQTQLAIEGLHAFAMFPCLYLSEKATGRILDGCKPDYNLYWQSYLSGELENVDGIALASSCLLVNREWFEKIGCFRREFSGHGCEDFELIHRLSSYYPIGKKPFDYEVDEKHQFPGHYKGFRQYYSFYALPHFLNKCFLVHQWHKRPLARLYHRKRRLNEAFFTRLLVSDNSHLCDGIEPWSSRQKIPDFSDWILSLMKEAGLNVKHYPGLFSWKEGVYRSPGGFKRKLRKLILKPVQFFKDMT